MTTQSLLEQIDSLRAEYNALQPLSEENRRQLEKKIRLEFNYNSNHLEGNTLTYGETKLLLLFDQTQGNHTAREYEEMKAHDVAFQLVQQWALDALPLSETDVKNLNKIILVRPFWKGAMTPDGQTTRRLIDVGDYKRHPNSVRLATGELFEYASPMETPALMAELVSWYNKQIEKADSHPLLPAALLHYRFVRIHPFDDGNGRVARLLMNYALMRSGLPPVIIKSADKTNYLRALHAADAGDMDSFVRYIGEQLIWSLQIAVKAARGETIDEPDDLDKALALLKRQMAPKEQLQEKASGAVIVQTIKQSVIPTLRLLEEKVAVIRELFFDIANVVELRLHGAGAEHAAIPGPHVLNNLEAWLNQGQNLHERQIQSLSHQIHFKGLKSSKNAHSFTIGFEVEFREHNYIFRRSWNPTDVVPLAYGEVLNAMEMLEIITPPVRKLIEQIEAAR